MPELAWLNGEYLPIAEAKVPVDDRGYQFGDGVYEVVRTYKGRLFALDRHMARLARSLREVDIACDADALQTRVVDAVRRASLPEALVYLQVTRGVCPRDHVFPDNLQPSVLITVRELRDHDDEDDAPKRAVLAADMRWRRPDIKSTNLLPNVLARQSAANQGAYEAIFYDESGCITEGSSTNVLGVIDGGIVTAPEGRQILSGISRAILLELARADGISVAERLWTRDELLAADEVLLTGTTTEVLGIGRVDEVEFQAPGPVTRRLRSLFFDHVDNYLHS